MRPARARATAAALATLVLLAAAPALAPLAAADSVAVVAALPSSRLATGAATMGDVAFVFGGLDGCFGCASLDEVVRYVPATNSVTTMGGKLPTGRASVMPVWTGSEFLVFGGAQCGLDFCLTDQVVQVSPSGSAAPLPGRMPEALCCGSAVWTSQGAFLFGGKDPGGDSADIWRYTPGSGFQKMGATMPVMPRSFTSAVYDGQRYVYLFGGANPTNAPGPQFVSDAVHRYDVVADQLVPRMAKLPAAMACTSAAWSGAHAYVFGGATDTTPCQGGYRDTILRYDPAADAFTTMPARMNAVTSATSAAWMVGKGYVFGGKNLNADIARYDPVSAPSAPQGLTAEAGPGGGQITLRWSAPASDGGGAISGYRVYRGPAAGQETYWRDAAGSPWVDSGLGDGATWHYQVTAVNSGGEGPRSNRASATTTRPPVAAIAPPLPAECDAGRGLVSLDGSGSSDPDGDPLSYLWTSAVALTPPNQARTSGSFPLGSTAVQLRVSDGKLSSTATAQAVVQDTLPPATTATPSGIAGLEGWWRSAVTVAFAAVDRCGSPSTTTSRVDGGAPAAGPTAQVRGEGDHAVAYASTDAAGNAEAPRTLALRIDTVPPATTHGFAGLAGDNGWFVSPVEATLRPLDATSGVARTLARVDQATPEEALSLTLAMEGRHELAWSSADRAGNVEPERRAPFAIDTVAPVTTASLQGLAGLEGWWRSSVTVTLAAADATSGVARTESSLDGDVWRPGTTVVVGGDGTHGLRFRSRDLAGNVEAEQSMTLAIDTTAPALTLDSPRGGEAWVLDQRLPAPGLPLTLVAGPKTVAGDATDATSGLARVELLLDDGPPRAATAHGAPYALPWDAGREGPGAHALNVRAWDRAGNSAERALPVHTVPTSPASLFAAECRFVAGPAACAHAPPGPLLPRPDLAPVDAACRQAQPPGTCDGLMAFLAALLA